MGLLCSVGMFVGAGCKAMHHSFDPVGYRHPGMMGCC